MFLQQFATVCKPLREAISQKITEKNRCFLLKIVAMKCKLNIVLLFYFFTFQKWVSIYQFGSRQKSREKSHRFCSVISTSDIHNLFYDNSRIISKNKIRIR